MCEPRNRDNGASDVWALTAYMTLVIITTLHSHGDTSNHCYSHFYEWKAAQQASAIKVEVGRECSSWHPCVKTSPSYCRLCPLHQLQICMCSLLPGDPFLHWRSHHCIGVWVRWLSIIKQLEQRLRKEFKNKFVCAEGTLKLLMFLWCIFFFFF